MSPWTLHTVQGLVGSCCHWSLLSGTGTWGHKDLAYGVDRHEKISLSGRFANSLAGGWQGQIGPLGAFYSSTIRRFCVFFLAEVIGLKLDVNKTNMARR